MAKVFVGLAFVTLLAAVSAVRHEERITRGGNDVRPLLGDRSFREQTARMHGHGMVGRSQTGHSQLGMMAHRRGTPFRRQHASTSTSFRGDLDADRGVSGHRREKHLRMLQHMEQNFGQDLRRLLRKRNRNGRHGFDLGTDNTPMEEGSRLNFRQLENLGLLHRRGPSGNPHDRLRTSFRGHMMDQRGHGHHRGRGHHRGHHRRNNVLAENGPGPRYTVL